MWLVIVRDDQDSRTQKRKNAKMNSKAYFQPMGGMSWSIIELKAREEA